MTTFLLVALFIEMGLALIIVPWSTFWERNYFIELWPPAREFIGNYFVRGAVSGLGVVNLAAGFAELVGLFVRRRGEGLGAPVVVHITDEPHA